VAPGGCDSGRAPLYPAGGSVTFPDGRPLTGGWVEFQPVDATVHVVARGQIRSDGGFELGTYKRADGVMVGQYRALVSPLLPVVDDDLKSHPLSVDPLFRSFDTSGLRFTVTQDAAKNRFSILVKPPRK
jgi:hypothetical protein